MMGGLSPETCWASYKYAIIKILMHCWIFLYELYYDARIHERHIYKQWCYLCMMSFESFRISCSESTEWDSPLESLADWGRRSWTDRHTGAIHVPQLFGQRHRLGLQDRTRGAGLPRWSWAQVLLASGQGILTYYFTCHIQSLILHSTFFFLPSSITYVLDYFSSFLAPHSLLFQCFSTAGPWPGTGPWHQL